MVYVNFCKDIFMFEAAMASRILLNKALSSDGAPQIWTFLVVTALYLDFPYTPWPRNFRRLGPSNLPKIAKTKITRLLQCSDWDQQFQKSRKFRKKRKLWGFIHVMIGSIFFRFNFVVSYLVKRYFIEKSSSLF